MIGCVTGGGVLLILIIVVSVIICKRQHTANPARNDVSLDSLNGQKNIKDDLQGLGPPDNPGRITGYLDLSNQSMGPQCEIQHGQHAPHSHDRQYTAAIPGGSDGDHTHGTNRRGTQTSVSKTPQHGRDYLAPTSQHRPESNKAVTRGPRRLLRTPLPDSVYLDDDHQFSAAGRQ